MSETNESAGTNSETVPSLPEMWASTSHSGELVTGASFEEVRSAGTAPKMRCPDCGMWFGGGRMTERRTRAAVEAHRAGQECHTRWSYRQLLWEGKVPMAAARVRDELRKMVGARRGPGSFNRGSRGRRASVGSRDWAPYARLLKLESVTGGKRGAAPTDPLECAEFEVFAARRTKELAMRAWSTAEEIRTAIRADRETIEAASVAAA